MYTSENSSTIDSDKREHYPLYKYRFVILIIYVLTASQNALMWGIFSPLQTTLQDVYNESITYVNFATVLISNVGYIPANFLGNYVSDTFGLKAGMIVGGLFVVSGLWIRCLASYSFTWIFIGQIFGAFAQPYFYGSPQKFSNIWFGPSERAYATTFMVSVLTVSYAVGADVSPLVVDVNADNQTILNQIEKLMFIFALLGSACFLVGTIFMKARPPTPPSKAAAVDKYDYAKSLKTLVRDKNTMMMIVSTAIINGSFVNYTSVVQQLVQPFGINADQVSNVVFISIIAGLVGSVGGALIVQRYRKYHAFMIWASVISLVTFVVNLFAAESGNYYFYLVTVSIFAILITPIFPLALEYSVELAFPIAEATVGGIWFSINQISATVESLIIDQILGSSPTAWDAKISFVVTIVIQAVATIPLFFVKENLKRSRYEDKKGIVEPEEFSTLEGSKYQEDKVSVPDVSL